MDIREEDEQTKSEAPKNPEISRESSVMMSSILDFIKPGHVSFMLQSFENPHHLEAILCDGKVDMFVLETMHDLEKNRISGMPSKGDLLMFRVMHEEELTYCRGIVTRIKYSKLHLFEKVTLVMLQNQVRLG